jgi:hypothetical protein
MVVSREIMHHTGIFWSPSVAAEMMDQSPRTDQPQCGGQGQADFARQDSVVLIHGLHDKVLR